MAVKSKLARILAGGLVATAAAALPNFDRPTRRGKVLFECASV